MTKNRIIVISIYVILFVIYAAYRFRPTENGNGLEKLNDSIIEYEYVGDFREGLALVKKDGKLGFIDKTGELVIPLKWNNNNENTSNLDQIFFANGYCLIPHTDDTDACLIDKEGKELYSGKDISIRRMKDMEIMYVSQDEDKHSVYFVNKDGIKKMDQYENDDVVTNRMWSFHNSREGEELYFSLENLCGGNIVGKKRLEEEYGYQVARTLNCTNDGVGLITLLNTKTNKYGVVDQKGNIVVPFQYDGKLCMCYGLLLEVFYVERDGDCGREIYPIYNNVYKDGKLLYEKIPFFSEGFVIMGIFRYWAMSERDCRDFESTFDIEIPETVKKTITTDSSGVEVSRFHFGKNYLRQLDDRIWQLEDSEGNLLYPNRFDLSFRSEKLIYVETERFYNSICLTDEGDSIPSSVQQYFEEGIVKVTDKFPNYPYPLCEYNKDLSERDNYLNAHSILLEMDYCRNGERRYNVLCSDSTRLLPFNVDEVSHYSEGLLRLRLSNRYFFIDEERNGIITED